MLRLKLLLIAILTAGLVCIFLPSAVSASPLTQIEEGEKCPRLNEIVEEGLWSYKCKKVRKKKLWQLNGISSTTTTTSTTTTSSTIPPTTTVPSAPRAPSGLALTIKSPFDGTGTISWTDNSNNEENFYVSDIDPAKLGSTPLTSIWFKGKADSALVSATGYQNGFNYCYWVMASNSAGNSPWAGPICALAGTATTTTAATTTTTTFVPSYGGGGGSSSANWLGCYFKGKKMWGSVYIASSSWAADFIVYQSSSSWNSDLRVYTTTSSWAATSCGIWYITSSSWAADFKIYLTNSSWNADFSIYSTSSSWSAGR